MGKGKGPKLKCNGGLALHRCRALGPLHDALKHHIGEYTMAAMDNFYSLDETIRRIKEEHAEELKAVNDRLMASNIELELTKRRLAQANADRDTYMRLATKLVAQFGTVE